MKAKRMLLPKLSQLKTMFFLIVFVAQLLGQNLSASPMFCSLVFGNFLSQLKPRFLKKTWVKDLATEKDISFLENKLISNPRFSSLVESYPASYLSFEHARVFALYLWGLQLGISKQAMRKVALNGHPFLLVRTKNKWILLNPEKPEDRLSEKAWLALLTESDRLLVKELNLSEDQDGKKWSLYSKDPYISEVINELKGLSKDPEFYTRQSQQFVDDLKISAKEKLEKKATPQTLRLIWNQIKSIASLDTTKDLCFVRSAGVALLADLMGIPPENVRKIWAYGRLIHAQGSWHYHVATAILGNDDQWYAIDTTLNGPVLLDEWIQGVQKYDKHNLLRLKVSDSSVLHPNLEPKSDRMVLDHYTLQFKALIPNDKRLAILAPGIDGRRRICTRPQFARLLGSYDSVDKYCASINEETHKTGSN